MHIPYFSDREHIDNQDFKKYVTELLFKNYFYISITKEEWGDLYDIQFEIFERLYIKFDLGIRLALMDIFTKDLLWQNYFPLNKLVLRQIVEL